MLGGGKVEYQGHVGFHFSTDMIIDFNKQYPAGGWEDGSVEFMYSQHLCKIPGMSIHICNTVGWRQVDIPIVYWPVNLVYLVSSRLVRDPVTKQTNKSHLQHTQNMNIHF